MGHDEPAIICLNLKSLIFGITIDSDFCVSMIIFILLTIIILFCRFVNFC